MFRLIGTTVLLGVVLAGLALVASAAVLPPDAPDYNWAQREPSTGPYEPTEPAGLVVVKVARFDDTPTYNWAQREPSTAPYEPTEPAGLVVVKVARFDDIPAYNWAQREPSTAPYEPTEPATHH